MFMKFLQRCSILCVVQDKLVRNLVKPSPQLMCLILLDIDNFMIFRLCLLFLKITKDNFYREVFQSSRQRTSLPWGSIKRSATKLKAKCAVPDQQRKRTTWASHGRCGQRPAWHFAVSWHGPLDKRLPRSLRPLANRDARAWRIRSLCRELTEGSRQMS